LISLPAQAGPNPSPSAAAPPVRGRSITFGFIPALDGLRALAVLGVMMYHGGASFLGGGFLTIDVFFVLSGFLITSLLIGEWRKRLTIRLGQFWSRRARRLLPALLVMLLAVVLYARYLATPDQFIDLRLDSLSTLFYVANWHFIFSGTNYFNLTAQPSPLQHMWSLSIEEQFYLVWPLVVLAMLWLGNKLRPARRLWPLLAAAVVGAVASAVEMALLYHGPSSVMRVYEGTDTRSQELLVGAALAVALTIWAEHRPKLPEDTPAPEKHPIRWGSPIRPISAWEITPRAGRIILQVMGWGAIAVFAYLWSHLSGPTPFLFRGGYFLVAVAVAVVIFTAVTNQLGSVSRSLGNPVFQYVGKISYGTYLWHFPLFAVLSASRTHLLGYSLLVVRIGVTLLVATASYYLVEEPIRRSRMRSLTEWRAWLVTSGAFLLVAAVTVGTTLPTTAGASSSAATRPTGAQYTGPPVSADLFGDSVAFTMGEALVLAQAADAPYDVDLIGGANLGCGVVMSTDFLSQGVVDSTTAACNPTAPLSQQWPALWKSNLAAHHPDVTLLEAGRWEVSDAQIDGKWMHIGQPAYDAVLKQSLEQAVRVGTADGALMILLTAPCFSSGEQNNGQPWPADSPTRLADYNAMLQTVAAEYPQTVEVYDFGSQVCPGGNFTRSIDGTPIRQADGVHMTIQGSTGQWLASKLYPEVVRVGRLQQAGEDLNGSKVSGS
jgi:peptidoglycan/LPS O-acetylase OafA/YrhL